MKRISLRTVVIAAAWSIWFLLSERSLKGYSSTTTYLPPSPSALKINNSEINVETVLIIATVPYSPNHVMALWTQLECLTSGIDKVLISAPDTSWSVAIISQVINRFEELSNTTTFSLEAVFNQNNRYDVGLWCDGLDYVNAYKASIAIPHAIFLINDSVAALRRYDSLTEKAVAATQTEQLNTTNNAGGSVKLISLNGEIHMPGVNKTTWVESVYRGLTPGGLSTFYQHSCAEEVRWVCAGKKGNRAKQCIIDRFEKALASSYSRTELGVMYPSYLLPEWNVSSWEASNGHIHIEPNDHWIFGRHFFWYLYDVHDFPFRKLKWPTTGLSPPESQCLSLLGGKPLFDDLPYPSIDVLNAYRTEMSKSNVTNILFR